MLLAENLMLLDAENALRNRQQAESQDRDRDTDYRIKQDVSRGGNFRRVSAGGDEQNTSPKTHHDSGQTDDPSDPVNKTHNGVDQGIGIRDCALCADVIRVNIGRND